MTADLFPEMQRTECPPLVAARNRLEELRVKRDMVLEADDYEAWIEVQNELGPAEAEVRKLEREEASKR